MAYKKKCPKCGEYTYSASREIWKYIVCGQKLMKLRRYQQKKRRTNNAKNTDEKKL